jgi:hypothetical protein
MALLGLSVVQARGVHALPTTLALAAAGVDFHADTLADAELVDVGAERGDRAHIFMTGRKILVEGQAAQNAGGRAGVDDFEVGRADRDCIDAYQHFGARRDGHGLAAQEQLFRSAKHPGLHLVRDGKVGRRLDPCRSVHWAHPLFEEPTGKKPALQLPA